MRTLSGLSGKQHWCKCRHCATIISLSIYVPHSLSPYLYLFLSLCLSLSARPGDSLFCRKCSHHTNCRLVYSRFNLIIASPAFNQPASACFMPKPHCKYKIDFNKHRQARLSLRKKLSRDGRWGREWGCDGSLGFCLLNIRSVSFVLTVSLQDAKGKICLPSSALRPLRTFTHREGRGGEQLLLLATRKDWHIFTCMHMRRRLLSLTSS